MYSIFINCCSASFSQPRKTEVSTGASHCIRLHLQLEVNGSCLRHFIREFFWKHLLLAQNWFPLLRYFRFFYVVNFQLIYLLIASNLYLPLDGGTITSSNFVWSATSICCAHQSIYWVYLVNHGWPNIKSYVSSRSHSIMTNSGIIGVVSWAITIARDRLSWLCEINK